jgi:hypothetical protein
MLFFGYFSFLIVAFTAVAMWLTGLFFSNSTSEKHYHPRPAVAQTEETARLHLEVAKEASPAKVDVPPVKHHKPKMLARQRNNDGYGNVWGYAQAFRNDPRGFFIH